MKNYLYIIVCFSVVTFACNRDLKSQIESSKQDSINNSTFKIHIDSSYSYTYDQFKESIVRVYVDSLNLFKKGTHLPFFLMNSDLDVNSEINNWPNSNFVSLREEIFKRVDNIELLQEVTQNPYLKDQFKNIEKKRPKIPSDRISNYTLAHERLTLLSKH
jgi:hypothetical protein